MGTPAIALVIAEARKHSRISGQGRAHADPSRTSQKPHTKKIVHDMQRIADTTAVTADKNLTLFFPACQQLLGLGLHAPPISSSKNLL